MRKRMLWTIGIVFFGVVLAWLGIGQAQQPNEWTAILKNSRPNVDYVRDEILIAFEPRVLIQGKVTINEIVRALTPRINRLGLKISRRDTLGDRFRQRSSATRICGGFIITLRASGDIAQMPSAFTDLAQEIRTYLRGLSAGLEDTFFISPNEGHHMPQANQDIPSDPLTTTFNLQELPSRDVGGLKVAVLDSGTAKTLDPIPDDLLPGILYDENFATDFSPERTPTTTPRGWQADYISFSGPPTVFGHGTPIAGIIATIARNTRIMPIKVCTNFWCTGRSVTQGLCWASDNAAKVINLSLGSFIESPIVKQAVRDAIRGGALVVAAAGNSRALSWTPNRSESTNSSLLPRDSSTWNAPIYPAAWSRGARAFDVNNMEDGIVSVGSIAKLRDTPLQAWISPFTYFGPTVDVVTYGEKIQTAFSLSGLWSLSVHFIGAERSGTSFSAPIISAVAASLLASNPGLSPVQVKARIIDAGLRFPLICYKTTSRYQDARNGCASARDGSAPRPIAADNEQEALVYLLDESRLSALLR
jgi:hypothetical protein